MALTVGALAIAADGANVVGAVQLTCGTNGLRIVLVRAVAFAWGFAPGAVTAAQRIVVPYTAVRGLVRRGRALHLALDPAVVTPHNRFALARFSLDAAEVPLSAHRARARARFAAAVAPLPAGVLVALATPARLASGALGPWALGLVVALVVTIALRALADALTWGGRASDRVRDAFERELAARLGIAPPRPASFGLLDEPRLDAPAPWVSPAALRQAAAVVLAAACAVALAAGVPAIEATSSREPIVPLARRGSAAAIAELGRTVALRGPPPLAPCSCARADSPLWAAGIPVLSLLTDSRRDGGPIPPVRGPDQGRRYDFDLVAVNNGSRPLRDVRIVLTFARRTRAGRRVGATDRGLFWGGELAPGQAAKWHVEAPGTELTVDVNVQGMLGDPGVRPAPADAFYELATSARHRIARLHAAMMLAYLRDPRAADAARGLVAESADEHRAIAAILRAAAPRYACDLRVRGDRLEACVANDTDEAVTGIALREPHGGDAAPRSWALVAEIPARTALRIAVPLDGGNSLAPESVDVLATP